MLESRPGPPAKPIMGKTDFVDARIGHARKGDARVPDAEIENACVAENDEIGEVLDAARSQHFRGHFLESASKIETYS